MGEEAYASNGDEIVGKLQVAGRWVLNKLLHQSLKVGMIALAKISAFLGGIGGRRSNDKPCRGILPNGLVSHTTAGNGADQDKQARLDIKGTLLDNMRVFGRRHLRRV